MAARPSESPVDISSNSPTPTRPVSLPRRPSSRLRDINEPIGSPGSHSRTRQSFLEDDEEVMPLPPPRRREPYVSLPSRSDRPGPNLHRPAAPRHGLAIPAAPVAGPSRPTQVIDLTEDDDDDIEYTGEAPTTNIRRADPPMRPHQTPRGAEIRARIAAENERYRQAGRHGHGQEAYAPYDVNAWRDLNQIDQVVEDHRRAAEAFWQDREVVVDPPNPVARDNALAALRQRHRRHAVERYHDDDYRPPPPPDDSPPPPPRARIGLGGAVLRRGNQQINYGAALPARRPEPYPVADLPQYEARLQERVERVRRAREAQHAGHPAMIANIVQNLMNGGDPNGERMEALLHRLRPAGGIHPDNRPMEDPSVIIARIPMPDALDLPKGFTSDFDLNDTIEIDQPKHAKRFMACTKCGDPLYINDGVKSQNERVWGLRCGHLLDQKCLLELSSPQVEDDRMNIIRPPPGGLDILGEEGGKVKRRGYKRKASKKTVNEPVEYEWKCPVKSCGWGHVSVLTEAEWKQDEEEGAVQLYV